MSYEKFKAKYVVENFTDKHGDPKHTRLVKHQFYKYANQLKNEFGFDLYKCSDCGITEWNGKAIVMEIDNLNRITNDSRIQNLRVRCPNCHSQTDGYKNRTVSIDDYVKKLKKSQKN